MLAAGILQDTFAGEVGEGKRGGEVETTGGYFYHPAGNSSHFVAIEFELNFYRKSLTHARVVETYVRIYTYIWKSRPRWLGGIRNVRTYIYIYIKI